MDVARQMGRGRWIVITVIATVMASAMKRKLVILTLIGGLSWGCGETPKRQISSIQHIENLIPPLSEVLDFQFKNPERDPVLFWQRTLTKYLDQISGVQRDRLCLISAFKLKPLATTSSDQASRLLAEIAVIPAHNPHDADYPLIIAAHLSKLIANEAWSTAFQGNTELGRQHLPVAWDLFVKYQGENDALRWKLRALMHRFPDSEVVLPFLLVDSYSNDDAEALLIKMPDSKLSKILSLAQDIPASLDGKETGFMLQYGALGVFSKRKYTKAVPILINFMKGTGVKWDDADRRFRIKLLANSALMKQGDASVTLVLAELKNDDPVVREAAINILGQIALQAIRTKEITQALRERYVRERKHQPPNELLVLGLQHYLTELAKRQKSQQPD